MHLVAWSIQMNQELQSYHLLRKYINVSRAIAKAVAQSVIDQGLNAETIDDIDEAIEAEIWYPEYKSYI